jgi:hypothetical protein
VSSKKNLQVLVFLHETHLTLANLNAQNLLSPWSNFDLDAIVKSFPEAPVPGLQEPGFPKIPQSQGVSHIPWDDETDVLFGLMRSDFGEVRGLRGQLHTSSSRGLRVQ